MKFAQNANYVSEARFLANRRSWRRGRPAPAMLPLGTRCGLHHAARRSADAARRARANSAPALRSAVCFLPASNDWQALGKISTVVTLACDCDHKNAFFHRWSGVASSSAKTMFLEKVRGEPVMPVPTAIHFLARTWRATDWRLFLPPSARRERFGERPRQSDAIRALCLDGLR